MPTPPLKLDADGVNAVLTAAFPDAGSRDPKPPMRKYIGISIASKNT